MSIRYFALGKFLHGSSSSDNAPITPTGCAAESSTIGLGCLRQFIQEDIDHLHVSPMEPACQYCGARRFPHESQYLLFFQYGDVGWQQHILKSGVNYSPTTYGTGSTSTVGFLSFSEVISGENQAVRGNNERMVSCKANYYLGYNKRRNHTEIRSEIYKGIVDSVLGGETRDSKIGHRIFLPTSFIGGLRDMRKRYLDAIALVKVFGKPDLFLTITCNPESKEIKDNLYQVQVAHDRLNLVSRVFRSKLVDLKDQILKKCIFGCVAAYVYVIEFQNEVCHIVLCLLSYPLIARLARLLCLIHMLLLRYRMRIIFQSYFV
ncbi:uncharacterized protein [Henckelia pumila]|uniref:uncharacterized protein n=1 Tax=Henckelia pumila TaxID=405737 RepID=UPI003C6E9939